MVVVDVAGEVVVVLDGDIVVVLGGAAVSVVVVVVDGVLVDVVVDVDGLAFGASMIIVVEAGGVLTTGGGLFTTVGFSQALTTTAASDAANNTEYFMFISPNVQKERVFQCTKSVTSGRCAIARSYPDASQTHATHVRPGSNLRPLKPFDD